MKERWWPRDLARAYVELAVVRVDDEAFGSRSPDVEVAVEIAREHRLPVECAAVLHDSSSVIVRLARGGPVARVGGLTAVVRDLTGHYAREVAIAGWLAEAGAPVVAPWDPAGPFERRGRVVTFWQEAVGEEATEGEVIGGALRSCHEALRGYDGELPPLTVLFEEAGRIFRTLDLMPENRALVTRALDHAMGVVESVGLPVQALHGDAALGNVLAGGAWNDWENCCVGPVVWDLACLVSTARILGLRCEGSEAALAAYGDAPGLELLEVFVRARAVQSLAWSLLGSQDSPEPAERTIRRLEWLRRQDWAQ